MRSASSNFVFASGEQTIKPAFAGNSIPVFFGSDNNYFTHIPAVMESILANSSRHTNYDFLVFTEDVSAGNLAAATEWAASYPNVSLRVVNVAEPVRLLGIRRLQTTRLWPVAMYYRLLAIPLLASYEKAIYLDADVICTADIAGLFNEDLEGFCVGACQDRMIMLKSQSYAKTAEYWRNTLELKPGDFYFNSGVLLLNLAQIRELDALPLILDKLKQGGLRNPDQDALNWAFRDRAKQLPEGWNIADGNELDSQELSRYMPGIKEYDGDVYILHYTGIKPWSFRYMGHNFEHYWKYAVNTPFYEQSVNRLRKECGLPKIFLRNVKWLTQLLERHLAGLLKRKDSKQKNLLKIQRLRYLLNTHFYRIWRDRLAALDALAVNSRRKNRA